MKIQDAIRWERVRPGQEPRATRSRNIGHAMSDPLDLAGPRQLDQSLPTQPEARARKMARLRALLATRDYPPEEIIRVISRRLADHHLKSHAVRQTYS
jgi:hypothetical protein